MASEKRIAQIGCGHWGMRAAQVLNALGVLDAVVDVDEQRAKRAASISECRVLDIESVVDDPEIHAVSIATPTASHFGIARRCLLAEKDVFVEKPMTLLPDHARELVTVAEQRGRILMVGHLMQYHPAFKSLLGLIETGSLGRLQYVYSTRLSLGKIRREEDCLWSLAPHDISMILRIAGEQPSEVRCIGMFALQERIADATTTHLVFPSGLHARFFVSWLHPLKEQRLVVIGEKAMVVFDDCEEWERKLAVFAGPITWRHDMPIVNPTSADFVEVERSEPLHVEMAHFIDSIERRTTPATDGREGLRVLEVLDAATFDMLGDQAVLRSPGRDSRRRPTGFHETAIVHDDAMIGRDVSIWHYSRVLTNCKVGDNTSLGQNVVVGPNVTIGRGCRIQNNVSVYDGVTLEDEVFCGPGVVFTNVKTPRAFIDRRDELTPTLVMQGASIGANSTIVCGSTIGRYSLIGAGAVVTANVPDHALMVGSPARQIGWVSRAGEVLDDDLTCSRTGESYDVVEGSLQLRNT